MKGHMCHAHTCSAEGGADITHSLMFNVLLLVSSDLCHRM